MTRLRENPASGLDYAVAGEIDAPRALIVLLHGYGVDHEDMLSLAIRFAEHIPEAMWLVPRAPFGLEDRLSREQIQAARKARPDLDLRRKRTWVGSPPPGAPPPDGPDGPDALRDGVAALTSPAATALASAASAPRTLMVVGERELAGDPWKDLFPYSVRCLKRLGVPVEEFVIPGVGHGGTAQSDRVICTFMRKALGLDPIRLGPVAGDG